MGGLQFTQNAKPTDVIVLNEQDDDRIVLVEQMWKYKRDLTRYVGLRHGFVVTTTARGEKTMRDIIVNKTDRQKCTRMKNYAKYTNEDFVYSRIKVNGSVTEKELQARLDESNTTYDPTENNCWHYSHRVVEELNGETELHPYLKAIDRAKSGLKPFFSTETIKGINQYIAKILV
jgi:hypothetical protein